jgi:hypothetical protein
MNILEIQAELEYWPDQKLIQESQQPTGAAPAYLVITEGERRNQVRQDYEARLAQQEQPQTTVAEETMMELGGGQPMGGIPDVDPNLMQNQMQDQIMAQQMPQQQMPQQMPQGPPMAMSGGGAIPSRYQFGQAVDPRLMGEELEGGPVSEDEAGFLTQMWQNMSTADKVALGVSGAALAAPIPGARIMSLMRGIPLLMKGYRAAKPLRTGLGKITKPLYKTQPRNPQGRYAKDWEVGERITNYLNPRRSEFYTRTAPVAGITGVVGSNIDMGTAEGAEAEIDQTTQALLDKWNEEQKLLEATKSKDQDRYSFLSEQLEKTIRSPEERRSALQGAALAQIGAGIAGGDVAGGLANAAAMVSKTQALEDEQAARAYGTLLEAETARERTVSLAQEKKVTLQLSLLTAMIESGVVTSDPEAVKAFYASLPEGIQAYLATGEGRDFTKDTFPADREKMLTEIKKRINQTQGA